MTGHIKDPVPLVGKSRASCLSGRFSLREVFQHWSSLTIH